MKLLSTVAAAVALTLVGFGASAATLNFKEMADGSSGESGYSTLSVGNLDITATQDGNDAIAYLDADNAGLGVCGSLSGAEGPNPFSSQNVCSDSSDDSIQFEETEILTFSATGDVAIDGFWINHNHDQGDNSAWEWIIAGETYYFADLVEDPIPTAEADAGDTDFWLALKSTLSLSSGDSFTIELVDGPNSYISGVSVVPLPAAGWLMIAGLGGLAAMRRRKS